jgi:hypothetical protein
MQFTFIQAWLHSTVLRETLRYGHQRNKKGDQLTTWSTAMKPGSLEEE